MAPKHQNNRPNETKPAAPAHASALALAGAPAAPQEQAAPEAQGEPAQAQPDAQEGAPEQAAPEAQGEPAQEGAAPGPAVGDEDAEGEGSAEEHKEIGVRISVAKGAAPKKLLGYQIVLQAGDNVLNAIDRKTMLYLRRGERAGKWRITEVFEMPGRQPEQEPAKGGSP
jgi:hypothetical protein